jgi:hypothetical protein
VRLLPVRSSTTSVKDFRSKFPLNKVCRLKSKPVLFLWSFLSTITFTSAQNEINNPLVKAGGFINFIPGAPLYSLNFEIEKSFRKVNSLTSGLRLDYINPKNLDKTFFIGYNFKFYPLYQRKKIPYRGVYLGIEPLYLIRIPDDPVSRYGPGIGYIAGYQHIIKDKIYLSIESDFMFVQNLNKRSIVGRGYHHPSERYFYFLSCIKVGLKLKGKESKIEN